MSTDGRPYAVAIDGPNIALPLRNKGGLRQRLARQYADTYPGEVASQSALADAMTVLEGLAEDNDPVPVHLRVGMTRPAAVVVDLGTADGRAVVVTDLGWKVADRSPLLFRRSGAMAPMPPPVLDGDGLAKLHSLLNMDESAFHQLVAWLVAAWIPDIPHPALVCKGEQGTGKSKAAQMFINLIDPSPAAKRSQPRDPKAWTPQAFASWALCLDNVCTIQPWLSDTLCKAVTGDGVVDRALYTDDDVVVFTFRRVLALTTIDAGALAGDLAERVLHARLAAHRLHPAPLGRRTGRHLRARPPSRPRSALRRPGVRARRCCRRCELDSMPRMADFARVLAAVDQTQGWRTLDDYLATSANVATDALEGDPFALAIGHLVDQVDTWQGTAAQLLEALGAADRPPHWPKDATRARGRIKRLAPLLRSTGITVDDTQRSRDRHRHQLIILSRTLPASDRVHTRAKRSLATGQPDRRGTNPP